MKLNRKMLATNPDSYRELRHQAARRKLCVPSRLRVLVAVGKLLIAN